MPKPLTARTSGQTALGPATETDLEAICRQRGGRLTRQRRAILATLIAVKRPLTAYELLELLKPADPAATPASTYRSLEFLVGVGLAHRLETTRSFVACEHPEHLHAVQFLICRTCGTVVETEDKRLVRAADELGERHGFALDHRTVELTGVCGACRNEDPAAPSM
jgi:Fur family zinc uptake transcriptional regulator